jgi:glycosyltransferase involved in cell wall biosynthesis
MQDNLPSITHINSYFIASPLHSELVSALDKQGIRQHVFVPVQKTAHLNKNMPGRLEHGEINYTHCFSTLHRYLWPLKMLRIWQAFKKHFSNHPAKLIHAHTLIVNGLIAYWAHKKWGTPYIVTVRNTDLNVFLKKLPFLKPLALKVLDHAEKIITISPAYRDEQLHAHFPKEKHQEIYRKCEGVTNGIHDFWIENRRTKENRQEVPTLIFSGRVDKNKNLEGLMDACKLLTKEGFGLKLNVLGDGPLLAMFKKRDYGFPVSFHGYISDRAQLLQFMRQSDLMAVPSFAESFGLVYPEAMSQGLPVIYTRGQGFDGHFPDGHVGFAVDPNSPYDIAKKIKMVFADYELFSANAFKESLKFSWDKVAKELQYLYSTVTNELIR